MIRQVLFWSQPRGFRGAAGWTALIVVATLLSGPGRWTIDGAVLTDGHAILSLDMAMNRAFCGVSSAYSSTLRVPMVLSAHIERRHEPLRALILERSGTLDAYCETIDTPYVNSENALMVIETMILSVMPGLSLSQVGQGLFLVKVAGLAAFVLLLMALGASAALGFTTCLCGLMLLQEMPDYVYSNYPFFFVMVLAAVALHGFAVAHRWTGSVTGLILYGLAAGVLSAMIVNLRTSYLPVAAAFFLAVLADELRRRDRSVAVRSGILRCAALAGCFLMGYIAIDQGVIASQLPKDGRFDAAHPFGHPLVLALAVPENALSREQDITWADAAGPRIAQRVAPGVPFLGPRYNSAMLRYYSTLWQTRSREMAAVYVLKFSTAGADMLRVLRAAPGTAGLGVKLLLTPLGLLPNGIWFLGLLAAVTAGAFAFYVRSNQPAAFALGLLSLAACLVQLESAIIFSVFVKQYHNYAAFYVLFLSLVGVQAMAHAVQAVAGNFSDRGGRA